MKKNLCLTLLFLTLTACSVEMDDSQREMDELKSSLEKAYPDYVSAVLPDYEISVVKENGDYLLGTLTKNGEHIPSYPGFYAFKSADGWEIIFSGQEVPECARVEELQFPNDIVPQCRSNDDLVIR